MNYATNIKNQLFTLIDEMNSSRWLFTQNPNKDFSRKKKWSFSEMMKFMISMEGKSLKDELYDTASYVRTLVDIKGYNRLHLNALYDLLDRTYVDAIIQSNRQMNEKRAMCDIFPTDDSLFKSLYLAMIDITQKWTRKPYNWRQIFEQLCIYFEGRVTLNDLI